MSSPYENLLAEAEAAVVDPPSTSLVDHDAVTEPMPPHTRWEYQVVLSATSTETIKHINALGDEGWELAAVLPPHTAEGLTVLYMKRERPS